MASRPSDNMSEDSRIDLIIERWEELQKQGVELSVDELCRDCPDLIGIVRKQIKALQEMEWMEIGDSTDGEGDADEVLEKVPGNLGRYRLDSLIGTGGFGQVWKGYDPELRRTIAIKVPRSGRFSSAEQAVKFLDEARKVAKFQHPGIVPVYDVGIKGDYCFIVSQYIEGGNLAEHLAGEKPTWQEAVRWIGEIAEILGYAHSHGVIHRDIKPANILLDGNRKLFLPISGSPFPPMSFVRAKAARRAR